LKVLHLAAGSLSGGAARGSYWLHRGLSELGVDSFFLTNSRERVSATGVGTLAETTSQKLKCTMLPRLGGLPKYLYRNRKPWIFNTGFEGVDFTKHPAYKEADILHLHWINGLVAMRTLRKAKKPMVWTLRDMWPLTGGCHYAMGCTRYELGCGQCPQLGSQKRSDLSRLVVANKEASLPKTMRVVGISRWLTECAAKSEVFRDFEVQTIGNNIDTNEFFPIDQAVAKQVLDLPVDKKIILIGAQSVSDFYKGFDLCLDALQRLQRPDLHLVLFGRTTPEQLAAIPHQVTSLGFLADSVSMRLAYSAADVFIAPSRMDAFGKTLAESMACGTPVVCFDATGPADIVEHQVTGYKAQPFDSLDLARGIEWVLGRDKSESQQLRHASRERAVRLFDSRVIAKQYLHLYEEMLS
jgi:glycosyltransferase involved in cell wall biosynthesis